MSTCVSISAFAGEPISHQTGTHKENAGNGAFSGKNPRASSQLCKLVTYESDVWGTPNALGDWDT